MSEDNTRMDDARITVRPISQTPMSVRFPTFFLSHGGGPWSYMTGEFRQGHATLESSLKELPRQLAAKPKVILVISGHWKEEDFAVMASPSPQMVYDFGGFPQYLYQLRYPAPGFPDLAPESTP